MTYRTDTGGKGGRCYKRADELSPRLPTIEWFKKIKNKCKATFTQFDIIDFYPSITKNILIHSINYARKYIEITEEHMR